MHVGDIHSGKQYCTEAYDQSIYDLWTRFDDPLVYTPGDNETTDCHKKAEGGGAYNPTTQQIDYVLDASGNPVDYAKGDPVANLDLIRSIFFAHPDLTLGKHRRSCCRSRWRTTGATPATASSSRTSSGTSRASCSSRSTCPAGRTTTPTSWYGAPTETAAQTQAREARTGADLRWLDTAFALAKAHRTPRAS